MARKPPVPRPPARPPKTGISPQPRAPQSSQLITITPGFYEVFVKPALEIWPVIPDIIDRVRRFKRNLAEVMSYINWQRWDVFEYPQVQRMLGEIEKELAEFMQHDVVKSEYTYGQLVEELRKGIKERNAAKALFAIAHILLSLPPQPRR
jgi:hypothetical protein